MDIDGIKSLIKLNNELTAVNSRMQSLLGTESYLSSLIATESELQTQLDSFGFFDRIFKRKEYAELKKQSLPQTKEQISALQESFDERSQ